VEEGEGMSYSPTVIVAFIPGRRSHWFCSRRFSTSARTRYFPPEVTIGLMKTTLPANRSLRPASKLHVHHHVATGDFADVHFRREHEPFHPQSVHADDLHHRLAGIHPFLPFMKDGYDLAIDGRDDLPPGDGNVGGVNLRLVHVGSHLGDLQIELGLLNLQLITLAGELGPFQLCSRNCVLGLPFN